VKGFDEMKFETGKIWKNKLYVSSTENNCLAEIDLETFEARPLKLFPEVRWDEKNIHSNSVLANDTLFFLPKNSAFIHAVNLVTLDMYAIKISDDEFGGGVACLYGDYLILFPEKVRKAKEGIVILNLNNYSIQYEQDVANMLLKHTDGELFVKRVIKKGDNIIAGLYGSDILFHYNVGNGKCDINHTKIDDIFGVYDSNVGIWVLTNTYNVAYKYTKGEIIRYNLVPGNYAIKNIVEIDKNVFVIPYQIGSYYELFGDEFMELKDGIIPAGRHLFLDVCGEKIIGYIDGCNDITIMVRSQKLNVCKINIDNYCDEYLKFIINEKLYKDYMEDDGFTLKQYIRMIAQ